MIYLTGFLMALADSVPGVSGGTIAYILGEYDNLLTSISDIFSRKKLKEKNSAFIYAFKLGIFWLLGAFLAINFLEKNLDTYIYEISSLFLGFVVISIPITIYKEKESLKNNLKDIYWVILGLGLVLFIGNMTAQFDVYSIDSYLIVFLIFFIGGFVASSALLLPGVSGSTILLIFGLYPVIVDNVDKFFHLELTSLKILIPFGLGVLSGFIIMAKAIKKALKTYHSKVIYFIEGLLLGSIFAIINGPKSLEIPQEAMKVDTFNFIFFIVGILIIGGIDFLAFKVRSKRQ